MNEYLVTMALISVAFLLIILTIYLIVFLIAQELYKKTPYYHSTKKSFFKLRHNTGAYGEYLTYKYLRRISPPGYFLFNVYLPKVSGGTTEIDVLLIHESGLYVFESKNYSGWIFGTENQSQWTQTLPNGRNSRKIHFFNPIMQNELHIKCLKDMLSDYTDMVYHSYILFSDRCTLKNIKLTTGKAQVLNRYKVYRHVSNRTRATGQIINQQIMQGIYYKLYPYTQVTESFKQKHIDNLNE